MAKRSKHSKKKSRKGPMSAEIERISTQLEKEYEGYKARVNPKNARKTRGKLHSLQRVMRKLKPLKIKSHLVGLTERHHKGQWNHVHSQIAGANKKVKTESATIRRLTGELKRLKRDVPKLKRSISSWSRQERAIGRKYRKAVNEWKSLHRRIAREEAKKKKVLQQLHKYFG